MKTKLIYVLTSSGNDRYVAMVELSLYTLRRHNSQIEVLVVMDKPTHLALEKYNSQILRDATPFVVEIPAEYNTIQRSRYLKTTLRQIIKGDFLFIDSDTLITEPLDDIDSFEGDIALVTDHNLPLEQCGNSDIVELSRKAGFTYKEGEPYFNSGVMFVRDSEIAYKLFSNWHSFWKDSINNGVVFDQPALCEANKSLGCPIKELEGVWNCQYRYLYQKNYNKHIRESKILHYYTARQLGRILIFLIDRTKAKGSVDPVVAAIVRWPRLLVYIHQISILLWRFKNWHWK